MKNKTQTKKQLIDEMRKTIKGAFCPRNMNARSKAELEWFYNKAKELNVLRRSK